MTVPVVVAVISSFRPAASLIPNVTALADQVSAVVVADDGSGSDASGLLATLQGLGVDVVRRASNDGIAVTLNAGIARARAAHDAEWILTLDQDTTLEPDYVRHLLETALSAQAEGLQVGAVSYGNQNGRAVALLGAVARFNLAYDPMQSGLLLPVSTLDTVGELREDLFIDWVDSEYNERMRAAGLLTLVAEGTNITHSLGTARPLSVFGRPVRRHGRQLSVAYHPPLRVYYMTRNGLLVARRSILRAPRWTLSRLTRDLLGHVGRVLVGPHRATHVLAAGFGVADALRGRSGKISARKQERLT
ncbi:glycosyltransferase [Arthrobacter sp. MDT2-16]